MCSPVLKRRAMYKVVLSIFTFIVFSLLTVAVSSAEGREPTDKGSSLGSLGIKQGDRNLPLFVTSVKLFGNAKTRVFRYLGNVEITQGDIFITADEVLGKYNEQDKLETVVCENNVVITKGAGMQASSQRAEYDVDKGVIVLTEGPELMQHGNVLTADKVIFYVDEDRSEAEGNVQVKVWKPASANGASSITGEVSKNGKES